MIPLRTMSTVSRELRARGIGPEGWWGRKRVFTQDWTVRPVTKSGAPLRREIDQAQIARLQEDLRELGQWVAEGIRGAEGLVMSLQKTLKSLGATSS